MSKDKGRNLVPTNEKKRVDLQSICQTKTCVSKRPTTPVNLEVGFAFQEHARLRVKYICIFLLSFGRGIATL